MPDGVGAAPELSRQRLTRAHDGPYHGALYRGLRDCQEVRHHEIAAAANSCSLALHAVVGADPLARSHTLRLALYAKQTATVVASFLRARPGAAVTAIVTRVASRLREAGLANVRRISLCGMRARSARGFHCWPSNWNSPRREFKPADKARPRRARRLALTGHQSQWTFENLQNRPLPAAGQRRVSGSSKPVDRALDANARLLHHVRVDHGRRYVLVSEERLHSPDVGSGL